MLYKPQMHNILNLSSLYTVIMLYEVYLQTQEKFIHFTYIIDSV